MRQLVAGRHVGCGIAYAKGLAVVLRRDVALDIADSCLDERCGCRLVVAADVLVSSKEAEDVLVLCK